MKICRAQYIAFTFFLCVLQANAQPNTMYSWSNLPKAKLPVFKKDTFSIARYGAVADGVTLNTSMIKKAIHDCSQNGGGVVLVPQGLWLSGPIELESNVNLHISRDAVLLFSNDFDQYRLVEGVYEGRKSARNQSPIYANNLVNIAITGKGIIDGNGDAWRMVGKDKLTETEWKRKLQSGGLVNINGDTWFPSEKTKLAFDQKRTATIAEGQSLKDFEDIKDYLRPNLLYLIIAVKYWLMALFSRILLHGVYTPYYVRTLL
jgi:polygalacturonase